MEFGKMEKGVLENVRRYSDEFGIKIDEEFAMFKLFEEVGEFAQAVLIAKKKSRPEKFVSAKIAKEEVAKELADVVGLAILNAKLLDIDLEKAMCAKWKIEENEKDEKVG